MKLRRSELKNLILKEMQRLMDEETLVSPENPGMLSRHDDPGRNVYQANTCEQCGSKMYEGESSCSECGAMYEGSHDHVHDHDHKFHEGACTECGMLEEDAELEENLNEGFSAMDVKIGNHGHYKGAYMSKSHLYKINKYAEKLYHMIPKGHNLEDWMRTKIAQIADDIGEVYHALDHDLFECDI